ncbi:MAG TPA: chemotaxis protein CheW [Thermoanaerobaculia bacterium]|nr:chemotaxis protein CheW [Thermoanaerobaculia bacterium]
MSEAALAFRSGGRRYSVPISEVREAARVPRLTPLPGSSARCAGVALVRGTPLAVLEIEARRSPQSRSLVLVFENRPFALLVDEVDGVEEPGSDATMLDLDALERET